MALLEAMSYHLPIVASDLEATRLVSLPDSNYCTPSDTESLKSAIEHILGQPCAPVHYDLGDYDWSAIAQRTHDVFTSVQ